MWGRLIKYNKNHRYEWPINTLMSEFFNRGAINPSGLQRYCIVRCFVDQIFFFSYSNFEIKDYFSLSVVVDFNLKNMEQPEIQKLLIKTSITFQWRKYILNSVKYWIGLRRLGHRLVCLLYFRSLIQSFGWSTDSSQFFDYSSFFSVSPLTTLPSFLFALLNCNKIEH